MHLLESHRQNPTADTTRRLLALLNCEATVVLRRHPARSLPPWVSFGQIKTACHDALRSAVAKLAHVDIDESEVPEWVQSEIEASISPLLVTIDGDALNRRRGHALPCAPRYAAVSTYSRGESWHCNEPSSDFRERIEARMDQMHDVATTKIQKNLLAMFWAGAPLDRIRKDLKLRGPDVFRILQDLEKRSR